jgi:hypothetical protein
MVLALTVQGSGGCAPGHGVVNSTSCQLCPPGTYSGGGTSTCINVPIGFYSQLSGQSTYSATCASALFAGAALCASNTNSGCLTGTYYSSAASACINVPSGYYSPVTGSSIYYHCNVSIHEGAATCGSSNTNACSSIGHYFDGSSCTLAPTGYYVPDAGAGVYYRCQYSKTLGAATCFTPQTICAPYTASDTNFAVDAHSVCLIGACPGTTITASLCGSVNDGSDTYLVLLNDDGDVLAHNDDFPGCDSSSQLNYTVTGSKCQTYSLWEGCYEMSSCYGTVVVTGSANCYAGQYFDGTSCTSAPVGKSVYSAHKFFPTIHYFR